MGRIKKSNVAGMPKSKSRANVALRRTPADTMQSAVLAVIEERLSIRAAAKQFNVPLATLHSYVKKSRSNGTDDVRFSPNYSV